MGIGGSIVAGEKALDLNHPNVAKWRYDANTPKLLYADQIECLSVEEFKRWLAHLLENPALYAKFGRKHHWLSECACSFHNRSKTGNTRSRVEAEILNHTRAMDRNSISLLSMGSGRLFQDLIILASLMKQGFQDVSVCMIEDAWHKGIVSSSKSKIFQSIVKQLRKAYPGVKVRTTYAGNVSSIPVDRRYDLVYAIDYDDFQVSIDSLGANRQQYQAQVDLMKAASKLSVHPKAAFFVSQGHVSLPVNGINQTPYIKTKNNLKYPIYYKYGVGQLMLDAMNGLLAGQCVYVDRDSVKKTDESALSVFSKRFDISYEIIDGAPTIPFVHAGNLRGSLRTQSQVVDFFVKTRFSGQYYMTYIGMLLEYIQSKLGIQAGVGSNYRRDAVVESIKSVSYEDSDDKARSVIAPAVSLLYKRIEKKCVIDQRKLTPDQAAQLRSCIAGCDRWLLRKGPLGSSLFMSSSRAEKRAKILGLRLALQDQSVSLEKVKKLYEEMRDLLVAHRSATCFHGEFPHSQQYVVEPVDHLVSTLSE